MKCINEVFVPTGWNVTTEEAAQNLSRPSWPLVTTTEENIFDLSVLVSTKNDEEPNNEKHQLVLNFIYGNNEISLVQESDCIKRESIVDGEVETGGKEFTYLLKVSDHTTNSVMYYDVKLARVEVEKKEATVTEDKSLGEHLEVITKLDDGDNPFNTEFDIPEDYKKKEK